MLLSAIGLNEEMAPVSFGTTVLLAAENASLSV